MDRARVRKDSLPGGGVPASSATLCVALLMVSTVPYPHVTKNILRGRRHFGHLMQVILAVFIVLLMRELALVLLFWVYALGLPCNYLLARHLRHKQVPAPRLEEGLPR